MKNAQKHEFSAIISKNFNYNFGKVFQISKQAHHGKVLYSMEIYTPGKKRNFLGGASINIATIFVNLQDT